jgi:addiction module HigA family antidote
VAAAAKWLGVSRVTLSELLNGHNGVTAEMAIRLEKAGWGSAESWLRNQLSHDLWQAKKRAAPRSRSRDSLRLNRCEAFPIAGAEAAARVPGLRTEDWAIS